MKTIIAKSAKHGNREILVDDEDYEMLSKFNWEVAIRGSKIYAQTSWEKGCKKYHAYMHRMIMGVTDRNIHVDHKNGNGLDNRKNNLRTCTNQQNMCNRASKINSTSKYLGVCSSTSKRTYRLLDGTEKIYKYTKWSAQIKIKGNQTCLGIFKVEEDAAMAYDAKAKEIHGEFAKLNFPDKIA